MNLDGKKTYLMALALLCYALGGAVAGYHDWNTAFKLVIESGLFSALRAGVAKSGLLK